MNVGRFNNLGGNAEQYRRATGWTPGTCTWCRSELRSRRLKWCPDQDIQTGFNACVAEFLARQNYVAARPFVWCRDQGTCRRCRRDLRFQDRSVPNYRGSWQAMTPEVWEAYRLRIGCGSEPWECDHIVPVAEGGGALGFENLQVLCVPCHKKKTAEQAARAAAARRPPEPPPLGVQADLFLALPTFREQELP